MQVLLSKIGVEFSDAKQDRSQKTLQDLVEAATKLVEQGDPDKFTARSLADTAGYALGTVVRRLSQVENVFLWVIEAGRRKHLETLIEFMLNCDPNYKVHYFCNDIVDLCMQGISQANPEVMKFFEARLLRRVKDSTDLLSHSTILVPALIDLSIRNQSQTFRELNDESAKFIVRTLASVIERPFLEDDPIAGTANHREQAVDLMYRVLKA